MTEEFFGDNRRDYFVHHGNITDTPIIEFYRNKAWSATTRTFETDNDRGYVWFNDGTLFNKATYWRVGYKPGYAIGSVPADLKGACKSVVTRIFKAIEKEGIATESFGDHQTNYALDDLLGRKEKLIIDRYRSQFLV